MGHARPLASQVTTPVRLAKRIVRQHPTQLRSHLGCPPTTRKHVLLIHLPDVDGSEKSSEKQYSFTESSEHERSCSAPRSESGGWWIKSNF